MDRFLEIIYIVISAIIAIVFHEYAHGYVSYKLGDPTPKQTGRLSLNIKNHIDPVGLLMLILFRFGYAKPVRVNPYYYKNKKQGMVLVALAGPIANFIIAFIAYFILGLTYKLTNYNFDGMWSYVYNFLQFLILINIGLGIFNLIPIPPLDGSKIFGAILPERYYFSYMKYERYGFILLIALLYFDILSIPLEYLREQIINSMEFVINLIFNI